MFHDKSNSKARYWARKLECPVDENANYENTYVCSSMISHDTTKNSKLIHSQQWCNRDLIPIPENRRTWTWQGYAGYWIITGK